MKRFIRWFFWDKQKNFVIFQVPNAALVLWFVCFLVGSLLEGPALSVVRVVGSLSLGYWSYLEVTSGVNGFRRLLGLVVGANIVWGVMMVVIS